MEKLYKYPRTFHFPWSETVASDDKVLTDISCFVGSEIVVTEKMDGENCTMYRDYIHARSVDGLSHPSRAWVKNMWADIRYDIPVGWRVCGESLYAKHSIYYSNLKSYFYGFSIWNENNVCLSWDETIEWFELLGIVHVPVLYRGEFDVDVLKDLSMSIDKEKQEGYVVRYACSFRYDEFKNRVAKFVRSNHVKTDEHWMHSKVEKNLLMEG
jgi:ATP-dependent RNA circularization protein (DNA/RNA ligase family)